MVRVWVAALFLLVAWAGAPVEAPAVGSGGIQHDARQAHSGRGGPAMAGIPSIEFEKYVLPNGLQVILHIDRKLPVVHVNQWYHVGSKNERLGRSGFAHLFEHMMFQGSANAPGDYFGFVERAGANLFEGGVNGTTDWDRTNYFATVPSGNLENLLWLESDRLATLADALTGGNLDNQRDVVKNERRQGLENEPYGRWVKLISENLFPFRHPYANDIIGSHEDLTAATLDDVKEFFRTYYTPNNLSLCVAGDFDVAEAKRLVEKYVGGIPAGPALDRPAKWIPRLEGERVVEVSDRVAQERTYFAWVSPAYFQDGDAELELASLILTDGLSSRLNKVLVYDKQLCSDATSFQSSLEIAGYFVIWATARPGASLREVEGLVTEEIARLSKEGPTASELARAQAKWEYRFISGLERIGGFGGKADRLNQYNTFLGDPGRFDEDVIRHRTASRQGVRAAVKAWLDTPNRLLVRFHPETSGREADVGLDRSLVPALGLDRPFAVPAVKSERLHNGLDVFVVERPDLPKVAVSLCLKAGCSDDPDGKEGLVQLLSATMQMGTATRKALEIEDELGDLGTAVGGAAERERMSISLEVLRSNLAKAMPILADLARHPVFPDSEVERERKRQLDGLAQDSQDPNAIAWRVGQMLAFGREHPYGRPLKGLPSTVQGLTREDLVRFHATHWKPDASALILAGDITLGDASALANEHFGSWSGEAPPSSGIPKPEPAGPGKVYLVDRQDAAQTVIMQILPGPDRRSTDYYPLRLADAVWGGGFGTRLNLNLREDKGYSYGVFSVPTFYSAAGVWRSFGGVQTARTKESVVEFEKELDGIAGKKPITGEELEHARANRVRGYAQQFESLSRVADQIAELWTAGLSMSELGREQAELEAAPLSSVNLVAQKYAVPGYASLLLVGDLSRIEAGIRELDIGDVVILDAEGRPVEGR